ncbi:MAG: cyclopropane fatty acyl phospholipid synthase [Candidatus Andersenbacteria bacterium]|nr:cyclopropane fatty acyl phospholipid synthase [Candidatus Andersenbacteria bacterium]MBI3250972.1 cyclopropane fatty acyl phospholipid synthase [Candidatus Andersenbacteria bacterium]
MSNRAKEYITELLKGVDIEVGGSRPWDIQVHDERLYTTILRRGSLGVGESYMDTWWDVIALDEFFFRVLRAGLEERVTFNPFLAALFITSFLVNRQRQSKAYEVGEKHYDIGNDVYTGMLDKRLTYTCGYWKQAHTLEEAQEAKLDLVCRKIGLEKGMTVLDIGCGWGSFAAFAAEKYGAKVVGVTVSKEQAALGQKRVAGLPVDIRLEDYRETEGSFDRIVSLGMFEHVGYKNYRTYVQKAHSLLKPEGLFLLHSIGNNKSVTATDPWIDKYIFPNGMLPSVKQIGKAIEGLFVMEDWHNFGADYDKTLMAWFHNFNVAWPNLKNGYSDTFYRMWKYYLLSTAGAFRARKVQLWQIVLSPEGVRGGYTSVR